MRFEPGNARLFESEVCQSYSNKSYLISNQPSRSVGKAYAMLLNYLVVLPMKLVLLKVLLLHRNSIMLPNIIMISSNNYSIHLMNEIYRQQIYH
jgi:hypothetical protein